VGLGGQVDARGGLVEDQQPRVDEQRPGEGQELSLADRQAHAALLDARLVPVGQRLDEPVRRRPPAPAASTSSIVASGRPKAMLSRTVPANRNPSWGTMAIWLRREAWVTERRSWPSMRTAPAVGS
jgi:hypothetical protein